MTSEKDLLEMGNSTDPEIECGFVKRLLYDGLVFSYFGELSKSTG